MGILKNLASQIKQRVDEGKKAAIIAEQKDPITKQDAYACYELDGKGNATGNISILKKEVTQYCYSTNKNQKLF